MTTSALLWLVGLVHAGPPSRELLDDIERWEAGQDALLEGPAGCWDLVGDARQVMTLHQPPDFFSAARNEAFPMVGTISGRMVDGVWQGELVQELKPGDKSELDLDVPIYPLFGTRPKKEGKPAETQQISVSVGGGEAQVAGSVGSSVNILREAIDEWTGSVETSLAQWDEEQQAVLYLREIPVSDKDSRPVQVTVRFPEAGPVADRIDAVWPRLIKQGDWPFILKIRDAQMHAVGHPAGEVVLPWAESLSFTGGLMGYTFGFEQSVTWRKATPCVAEAVQEPSGSEADVGVDGGRGGE